jgi:hypothetical protein
MTPDEALNHIRKTRPFIRPSDVQKAQLQQFAERLKAGTLDAAPLVDAQTTTG